MAKTKYDDRTRQQIASDVLKEKGLFGAIGTYLSGDFPQSESLKDPQGRVIRRQKGMEILKQREAEGRKRAARLKREKERQIAKNEEARKERVRASEQAKIDRQAASVSGRPLNAAEKAAIASMKSRERLAQEESARQSTGVLRSSANPAKPKPKTKPKPPAQTASTPVKTTPTKPKPPAKTKPTVKATTSSSVASKPATKTKTTGVKTEVAKAAEKTKDKDKKPKRVRRANLALARKTRTARRAGGGMMKSKMASKGGAKGGKRMPPGMKEGGPASKFPDFSGDGKVTQKDILMGKGVIGGRSRSAEKKKTAERNKRMAEKLANSQGRKRIGGKYKGSSFKGKTDSENKMKKMAMGGMMKSKGMAKGGAMKKKGYAMGGMTKKGMAKGGAMTKKGMAKGGSVRKTTKPRGVGAALRGFGKALK